MSNNFTTKLQLPSGKNNLLLHSCCAPCSGDIMKRLIDSNINYTVYFYNPNIHPHQEYLLRKEENMSFSIKNNIPFIDADYNPRTWFDLTKGMGQEPERGKRCSVCFDMRFFKTAEYASTNGFDIISSTLGISRWKDMSQINLSGINAASKFKDLEYWTFNWRKENGSQRMIEVSKDEKFYMQEYCGCVYSLRDTNTWREKNMKPIIEIGKKFYSHSDKDTTDN
ncbi:MAG: epoxyqueuosine reductase QueH [Gammaproteobacteria bacterium]|jgi:epoxyqueuosine reductase|nr:epoxyqueuosine reductase QueH [Gammaproteobacteria bacterium]MBT4462896.1 epoxyqueuosine reductase QueH [Gammaproteobacteria bacterium]MBT5761367.1 epoxyqueuosine reductase QueH [Gammaproteobacteria bacterium]MBT6331933.1 epoxyqueuosine reductase QueH [Gammaproteobacteria bacterium]MBT7322363.1 epoxyqueuosine reductase QueH [Gammaproteobacteria bacterium]